MPRPPWKYGPQILEVAELYIGYTEKPNVRGLARELGVSRESIYQWSRQYAEFARLLHALTTKKRG